MSNKLLLWTYPFFFLKNLLLSFLWTKVRFIINLIFQAILISHWIKLFDLLLNWLFVLECILKLHKPFVIYYKIMISLQILLIFLLNLLQIADVVNLLLVPIQSLISDCFPSLIVTFTPFSFGVVIHSVRSASVHEAGVSLSVVIAWDLFPIESFTDSERHRILPIWLAILWKLVAH